jgi:sphinganine-1-phosphate aldolase
VTAAISATAAEFGPDLADAVAVARARGPVALPPALLETAAALAPAMVTPDVVEGLAQGLGLGGGDFQQMAAVNTLLNAAPPRLREALLTGFLSVLQRPAEYGSR